MRHTGTPPLSSTAVVVFGTGRMPEMLLTCLQFRLAADLAAADRATPFHLMQLNRHIERGRCGACRGYLLGRMVEMSGRREWVDRAVG